eukprot:TRINITY_DN2941_c0_g1_i3.p1 TRINITY_DN2941_c0_g1~~TRINITY_DN2941_c0_g1_i3.p1  ORF type:complete len:185 (-),score=64.16 TRINITY_DN2941_c0_g1_i3:159-713(-)
MAAIEDEEWKEKKIHFWENVYEYDMSVVKEEAYKEPIIDNVSPDNIFTDCVPVMSVDLKTSSKEDKNWTRPFVLTAKQNDYCHALLLYFDAHFSSSFKQTALYADPFHKQTHYKHLIMYLKHDIAVCKGEKITGTVSMKTRNDRDVEIHVAYEFKGEHDVHSGNQVFLLPGKKLGKSQEEKKDN